MCRRCLGSAQGITLPSLAATSTLSRTSFVRHAPIAMHAQPTFGCRPAFSCVYLVRLSALDLVRLDPIPLRGTVRLHTRPAVCIALRAKSAFPVSCLSRFGQHRGFASRSFPHGRRPHGLTYTYTFHRAVSSASHKRIFNCQRANGRLAFPLVSTLVRPSRLFVPCPTNGTPMNKNAKLSPQNSPNP